MRFDIVTLFPQIIESYVKEGVISRGIQDGEIAVVTHDLRDLGVGEYKKVDDKPFGGGTGMVLMFEPIAGAIKQIKEKYKNAGIKKFKVIATTAKGRQFKQSVAKKFAQDNQEKKLDALIILCGRYEGFDQRVLDELVDKQISMGKYVMSGGELAALSIVDAVSRLIPGVLGKEESFEHDSFYQDDETVQYPQYTRPEAIEFEEKELKVPPILTSGDHEKIHKWRQNKARRTI